MTFRRNQCSHAPNNATIHTQNEGIINGVKNSAQIRFLAKIAQILDPDDIKREQERFTTDNLSADNKKRHDYL